MVNKKGRLIASLRDKKFGITQDSATDTSTTDEALGETHHPNAVGSKTDAAQKPAVITPLWIGVIIACSILIVVFIVAVIIYRIKNKGKSKADVEKSDAERSYDGGDSNDEATAAVKQRQKQASSEHERELANILSKRSTPFKAPTDKSCVPHDDPQYQTLYKVPDMDKLLKMSADMPSKSMNTEE